MTHAARLLRAAIGVTLITCSPLIAAAATSIDVAQRVGLDQHPGALLPLASVFRDERGIAVTLGDVLEHKPAILALVYYDCPNLCTVVLTRLLNSLAEVDLTAGRDFTVVAMSIDPMETPALAAEKRANYLKRYGRCRDRARDGCASGWRFLTGEQPSIDAVAQSVGFRYFRDATQAQFAHPIGVVVTTPSGRIARYFTNVEFPPAAVRTALMQATAERIDSVTDRFWLLCYHYGEIVGRYATVAFGSVRMVALLTALLLAGWIYRVTRRP